ncbi:MULTISPECIES: response regulator [unclassified Devosia]|uniref:response regulator n=1 Tax=unclassified Devosia TaxID=196773 RepID=UPI00145C76E0|nr:MULTISPECIES: response regulator [unclassified Devosia]MBJ6988173.1 response regulator [Devosia sp. MC521]QMW63454.1 response regulator [Devosia sp. MC521]
MVARGKTVAILAATPALTAVLAMVLAGDSRLRVRTFESDIELFAYMRIAPLDLLVVDFDRDGRPAYEMVEAIRLDPSFVNRDLPVIALTRRITPDTREQSVSAGIDEVVVKPMSPRHLLQRVQQRLLKHDVVGTVDFGYFGPDRRGILPEPDVHPTRRFSDNIVPFVPRVSLEAPQPTV